MNDIHDLEVLLRSQTPLIVVNSSEEQRVVDMLTELSITLSKPLFSWSITEGLIDRQFRELKNLGQNDATAVVTAIKKEKKPSIFLLSDFHPYLENPLRVRSLKEIALAHHTTPHTVILLSHKLELPGELRPFSAQFELSMPDSAALERLVHSIAESWSKTAGNNVRTDRESFDLLIRNLSGLTIADATRLARTAIYDDGAITKCDAEEVMKAKYELLNKGGVIHFEYDVSAFSDIAGLVKLKDWLSKRRLAFERRPNAPKVDMPKGALLLGVQGCGKSLAAKAIAGSWGIPLLRLDFGAIYQKYIGETEQSLRDAFQTATAMAPCVLWLDEIEKGIATGDSDGGTSRRILGMFLTWMAEKKAPVFIVATANDIEQLPAELVRKGRFDEIFFVDLPNHEIRKEIFKIHLKKRDLNADNFDLEILSSSSDGFSGAEIEQAVVSSLYALGSNNNPLTTEIILAEVRRTKPLSVVMSEKIEYLRSWASDRTVPAD